MSTSTPSATGSTRSFFEIEDAACRGIYGGRVFDGVLHSCCVCGRKTAIAHSVRIRQDERGAPRCFDCRFEGTVAVDAAIVEPCTVAAGEKDAVLMSPPPPQKPHSVHPAIMRRISYGRTASGLPVLSGIGKPGRPLRALSPLGDLVFRRDPAKGADVTAIWCGDPLPNRSALFQHYNR